jgi:signal peptidase I
MTFRGWRSVAWPVVSLSRPAEPTDPAEPTGPAPLVPPGEQVGPGGSPEASGPKWKRAAIEWGIILGVAVVAALVIRLWLIQPFFIPSGSMEPTLDVGDRVLVNKVSYDVHSVHRGDIVVFSRPPNDNEQGIKDLVKRVIGLPGETISSGADGSVIINGQPIKQPWLTAAAKASPGPPIPRMVIPSGEYFMMGDNRGNSEDSRYFGPVSGKLIVGRAFVVVWPLSRLGGL